MTDPFTFKQSQKKQHPFSSLCIDDAFTWKKKLGETGFLVCKSDIFLLYLYREELFLHVIRNLFFNRRDYVIQILSRYSFPASWDWSLQIISLIVDVEFCFLSFLLLLLWMLGNTPILTIAKPCNILEASSFAETESFTFKSW